MTSPSDDRGAGRDRDADRDRDRDGRARNARFRDRLGRPLPRGRAGIPPTVDDASLSPAQAVTTAQELLDTGYPFHAHEVLEAAWKSAPPEQRQLWPGLAQLAVGATHAARGNVRGAVTLLERGAEAIAPYAGAPPHELDLPGLLAWTRAGVALLEARPDGPLELDPPQLRRSAAAPGDAVDAVDELTRWERFGGTWRVLERDGARITVALYRCDGGEEQRRLVATDPALAAWLAGRDASDPAV